MSIRALCLGVEQRLRNVLADPDGKKVGYQPSGRPPASAGQTYVSVKFGGYQTVSVTPECDDRQFGVAVILTWKLAYAPQDRQGRQITQEGDAHLLDLADRVAGWLVGNWDVVTLANGFITGAGATTDGFFETFDKAVCGEVEEKSAEWVGAEDAENPPTVLGMTITLSGARRIRVLGTVA
jgi:hypothetical protein